MEISTTYGARGDIRQATCCQANSFVLYAHVLQHLLIRSKDATTLLTRENAQRRVDNRIADAHACVIADVIIQCDDRFPLFGEGTDEIDPGIRVRSRVPQSIKFRIEGTLEDLEVIEDHCRPR